MTELVDLTRVDAHLKGVIDGLEGMPALRKLSGGSSNLTFALDYPDRSLILRRPPPGTKAKGAHDMIREARIIAGLKPQFAPVPAIYAEVDDPAVMDTPFFVMEALDGLILRGDSTVDEIGDESGSEALCESFVSTWVGLHSVDAQRPELSWLNRGDGYVGRQIKGWSRRYTDARTPDAASFEAVMAWLAEDPPADQGSCLIHNDYRFDNIVLDSADPSRVVGVLDWELATVGCPLMDLGASLAYWVQADDPPGLHQLRLQPSHLPGMWTRKRLVERYAELSGRSLERSTFYTVYGLFRLAGIAQQIYYRHYHGQFTNERFAGFIHAVNYFEQRCLELIEAAGSE